MSGPDDSAASPGRGELPELLAARRRKLEALRAAGVDPSSRGEQLDVEAFSAVAAHRPPRSDAAPVG